MQVTFTDYLQAFAVIANEADVKFPRQSSKSTRGTESKYASLNMYVSTTPGVPGLLKTLRIGSTAIWDVAADPTRTKPAVRKSYYYHCGFILL